MPLIFIFLLFTATFFTSANDEVGKRFNPMAEGEVVRLPLTPEELNLDKQAEEELFKLVNDERVKAGFEPLEWDEDLAIVARAHSEDMWQRKYFAHENPDGETALERLQDGDLFFNKVGENLALTRTVERAHEGLMDSPGHKRNIMDPEFKKIGIGVVDGGIYGKMFTQNFSD